MRRPFAGSPLWKRATVAAPLLAAAWMLLAAVDFAHAGTAEEDWQAVVALDAGPGEQPKSAEAAGAMVVTFAARQEKALRTFLAAHPEDAHVFEAKIRLSRVLQIRAAFEQSEKLRTEAARLLESLEKTATPEQRPELEFAKIARMMRALHRSDPAQCQALLEAARRFQSDYANDRRVAALLTEVSTLFDNQPRTKESLLEDALAVAKEGDLKARITDDLKRVRMLGQVVTLSFTSVQGQEVNLDSFAGHPVFVIFFGQFSTQSMSAVDKLQAELAQLPAGAVSVVGVNLDIERETLLQTLKTHRLVWPVAFDGKGWESPLVRGFGINLVPTVWLVDGHGRLRSLNALEGAAGLARQLMRER